MTLRYDLSKLSLTELNPSEFTEILVREQVKLTLGERTEPLHLIMAYRPQRGLRVILVEGAQATHALMPNVAMGDGPETRDLIIGADEACTMMLEFAAERFPAEFNAAMDQTAARVLQDIIHQRADVASAVWLTHWVRLRAEAPRMGPEEAERLYGSAPVLNPSGGGALVEWDEPGRLLGDDAEFASRKQTALKVCCHEIDEALVKFTGSVHAAFLAALLKRTESVSPQLNDSDKRDSSA